MEQLERIMHMEKQLQDLTTKVDRIAEALLGGEFNNEMGLVQTVKKQQEEIEELKKSDIVRKVYERILIFIASGITMCVLGYIMSLIFKK